MPLGKNMFDFFISRLYENYLEVIYRNGKPKRRIRKTQMNQFFCNFQDFIKKSFKSVAMTASAISLVAFN